MTYPTDSDDRWRVADKPSIIILVRGACFSSDTLSRFGIALYKRPAIAAVPPGFVTCETSQWPRPATSSSTTCGHPFHGCHSSMTVADSSPSMTLVMNVVTRPPVGNGL